MHYIYIILRITDISTLLFCSTVYLFTECKDGEVRLVGDEYSNEGTVELCYSNLWGQISDVEWSNEDAKVAAISLDAKRYSFVSDPFIYMHE